MNPGYKPEMMVISKQRALVEFHNPVIKINYYNLMLSCQIELNSQLLDGHQALTLCLVHGLLFKASGFP